MSSENATGGQAATAENPNPHVRRIVTGHDENGKAIIWMDGEAENSRYPNERMISTLLWSTDSAPADWSHDEDYGARKLGTAPPANGTRFMHSVLQPSQIEGAPDPAHLHRTDSIDYKVIISGEVTMYLDDSKVVCRQGDVIISRGTNHTWINEGTDPCRSVTVLVDANPKRDDAVAGMTQQRH
jgi:mannose-6-phosphate isomerase-like protein (cupin superfamily)